MAGGDRSAATRGRTARWQPRRGSWVLTGAPPSRLSVRRVPLLKRLCLCGRRLVEVAGHVRVDRDTRTHRGGHEDLLEVLALGRGRLAPLYLVHHGTVV